MKYDLFFKLAKEAGLEESELYIGSSYSLSFSLFHGEVDKYKNSNSFTILARGKFNGKMGTAACDVWNKEKAAYLVNEIKANAKVIENDDPVFIFKGSEKYHKINTFNKDLYSVPTEKKLADLKELEKKIKAADQRITEVETVAYEESMETTTILNSHGLKLAQKINYFLFYGGAVSKSGEQTKTGGDMFFDNDYSKFNVDELATKIAKDATAKLDGEACASSTYKAILSQDVISSLIGAYIGNADAEDVQKHSSLFIGKLNEKVASSKVTIEDKPLQKSVFAKWFDDEGVATYNKTIIKNGVLKTYLYNLTTAQKEGVQTTGNASRGGGKMGISPFFLYMHPGKKSEEELFKTVGDGVYITEVSGLHAGLNPQSGNFSLLSTGFLIKDGKIDRPLDIITVSGNLVELFKSIVEVSSASKTFPSGINCPSVMLNKIEVSGK